MAVNGVPGGDVWWEKENRSSRSASTPEQEGWNLKRQRRRARLMVTTERMEMRRESVGLGRALRRYGGWYQHSGYFPGSEAPRGLASSVKRDRLRRCSRVEPPRAPRCRRSRSTPNTQPVTNDSFSYSGVNSTSGLVLRYHLERPADLIHCCSYWFNI